jgi:exodeoxyribonuclease-3
MKFVSWNVNGIRAVYKKGFVEWLTKESPDILAIQETKAHIDQLPHDLVNIEGYQSYFCSGIRKGYSGVAIYTKIKPESVEYGFGIEKFDQEGRILILKFTKFTFIDIYYPNGKSGDERLKFKLEFYQAFLEYLLKHKDENFVICGDVNTAHTEIDLARPKENVKSSGFLPEERTFLDQFLESGLIDTFRHINKEPNHYTWWDVKTGSRARNTGWRIDYFYISKKLLTYMNDAFMYTDVMGSDHCPIGLVIEDSGLK